MEETDGGLIYLVAALLPLAIYLEYFKPDVNDAENKYLRAFCKSEIRIILTTPLVLLVNLGTLKLLSLMFDFVPHYPLIYIYLFLYFFFHPGYLNLPRDSENADDIRYSVINKTVILGYFICHLTIAMLTFAIFGMIRFELDPDSIRSPPSRAIETTFQVNKNGEFVLINMSKGILTEFMYNHFPRWLLFIILFYVEHVGITASFRWTVFFFNFLIDALMTAIGYVI